MEKATKIVRIALIVIVSLAIAVFGVMTLLNHNKTNEMEQRALTQWPSPSKVLSGDMTLGEFFDDVTTAYSDQFFMRDLLVKGYYVFHMQSYDSGAMKGANGQLYRTHQAAPRSQKKADKSLTSASKKLAKIVDECADAGAVKFIYLPVPRKDAVMTEDLPDGYESSEKDFEHTYGILTSTVQGESKSKIFEPVNTLQLFSQQRDKSLYFATDHHWNVHGADVAYHAVMDVVAQKNPDVLVTDLESDYQVESVVMDGSLNRLIGMSVAPDPEPLLLTYTGNIDYTRADNGKKSSRPLFGKGGNTYKQAFMGEDFGETVIENQTAKDAPNILIVGSSYTNSLEALCVPSFHYMVSVDYRHNQTGLSIADYVKKYHIDYVVLTNSSSMSALNKTNLTQHMGLGGSGDQND